MLLTGPMGAGKSTVGPRLATVLGRPFLDLDRELEREAGESIAALFARDGERAFRRREAALLDRVLASPAPHVIALGGGALVDRARRIAVLEGDVVLGLEVRRDTLLARLGASLASRPLLIGGSSASTSLEAAAERLDELLAARRDVYADVHHAIDGEGSVDEVVTRAAASLATPAVRVALGERGYAVRFGAFEALFERELSRLRPTQVVIVTDRNVAEVALERAMTVVHTVLGRDAASVVIEPGELSKELASVDTLWSAFGAAELDRRGLVVALGGGVVGDLAGFAASTWMRGVRWLGVPTSLLAMVDSSVGGKTGFDRATGKNLVGSFSQPTAVIVDGRWLTTLPERERRAGWAEIAKMAWLVGPDAVALIEREGEGALDEAMELAIARKASIVARDEHERDERKLLNLGHTMGHAIELVSGFSLVHGEAVALGLVVAARVADALGASPPVGARMQAMVASLGLPDEPRDWIDRAVPALSRDKKRIGGAIDVVVPYAPGDVRIERFELARYEALVRRGG